jgi:hypothetical protein
MKMDKHKDHSSEQETALACRKEHTCRYEQGPFEWKVSLRKSFGSFDIASTLTIYYSMSMYSAQLLAHLVLHASAKVAVKEGTEEKANRKEALISYSKDSM